MTFRSGTQQILNSKPFFISSAIVFLALSLKFGAAGYIFGVAVVGITLWANRWNWSVAGLVKDRFLQSLLHAVLLSAGLYLFLDILIQPITESFFGEIDLSSFDGIRGNFVNFSIMIGFMWIVAAFGEELIYRGYLMKRFAELLGNRNESWFLAAIINGIFFGLAHLYQGTSGVITTGIAGFIFGLIYAKKRKLLVPILTHGIYDMIGLGLIYLDMERYLIDLINF